MGDGGDDRTRSARNGRVSDDARGDDSARPSPVGRSPRIAALDLGTNNCRLLVAVPKRSGFRVIDSFSRIVRLGEGLTANGRLSEKAISRTLDALKVCAEKIDRHGVAKSRCVATEACRGADNSQAFLDRVAEETGLEFDVLSPAEEAALALRGCHDLLDAKKSAALIIDIGGGSTELNWVRIHTKKEGRVQAESTAWVSLPFGVVSLSERYGGREMSLSTYREIAVEVRERILAFQGADDLRAVFNDGDAHMIGTSGTVTSLAGVHLGLDAYRRDAVDGLWLDYARLAAVAEDLRAMSFADRCNEPCIKEERADLVVAGCAILEGVAQVWGTQRLRVADRGLREGIILSLLDGQKQKNKVRARLASKVDPAPKAAG